MKKLLSILFVSLIAAGFSFAKEKEAPKATELSECPEAFVVSVEDFTGKKPKDRIRFVNDSEESGINFDVWVFARDFGKYDWYKYGTAHLKESGDTDFIDSVLEGKLGRVYYYAINPTKKTEGKFKYSFSVSHNDLYVTVTDAE